MDYIVLVILMILAIWNIALQVQFFLVSQKLKTLFQGQKMADLEGVLFEQIKRTRKNEESIKTLVDFVEHLEKMAEKGVQKVGLIRFNPFKDTGGNQSFALAILDSFDNGIVLSSLFTREGTRIYAKPLKNSKSTYPLSEEENEAIAEAKK